MSSARVPLYIIVIKLSSHWTQASVLRFSCSVLSTKGAKQVKTNFASPEDGYVKAQEAYNSLYYEDSEGEKINSTDNDIQAYKNSEEYQPV